MSIYLVKIKSNGCKGCIDRVVQAPTQKQALLDVLVTLGPLDPCWQWAGWTVEVFPTRL